MTTVAKQVEVIRPAKSELVSIVLCCNDPDNGMFNGRFCKVEIGQDVLTLDNQYWPPREPKLSYEFKNDGAYGSVSGFGAEPVVGRIKVSRQWFEVWGYKYGWGNWCWDLVLMTPEVTIDFVNYLKQLNVFQVESGETRWFNHFLADGAVFDKRPTGWIRMLGKWGYQRP